MRTPRHVMLLLALAALVGCERGLTRDGGARDSASDSVPVVEGFADAMEAEALAEPPCLTSADTVRRNWTREPVPSLNGDIMLPPRFERQRGGAAESVSWVNPDSARLSLVVSRTEQGGHAVGAGVDGSPERRCSIRVGGRTARLVELVVPRPTRGDTAFGAITIAFPNDEITISATIIAPTMVARTELLNALSTLTMQPKP